MIGLSFLLFAPAFQFPYFYCHIFRVFFFCYGLDLLLTLLMQFRNTFPQLSRVIYLQNNRQALTQVSFALLSFYGWHAPKGGQLLFRFLLLSGFLPYPFATYHFFLTFVLSLVFSRFTRPSFFPRRSRCHGDLFNFPPFSCRSFFPALRFKFFSPPYSPLSFLIFPVPLCFPRFRISADFFLKTPEPCFPFATSPASSSSLLPFFFQHPFRYYVARHFMKHCNFRGRLSFAAFSHRTFSHTVRLDGQTKSQTKRIR